VHFQFHHIGEIGDALLVVSRVKAGGVVQQVADFHMVVIEDLRWQITDLAAYFRTFGRDVLAEDGSLTAGRMDQGK